MTNDDVMAQASVSADAESEELLLQVRKLDALETTEPRPMFF